MVNKSSRDQTRAGFTDHLRLHIDTGESHLGIPDELLSLSSKRICQFWKVILLKQYCGRSTLLGPTAKDKWIYKTKHGQATRLIAFAAHHAECCPEWVELLVIVVNVQAFHFKDEWLENSRGEISEKIRTAGRRKVQPLIKKIMGFIHLSITSIAIQPSISTM